MTKERSEHEFAPGELLEILIEVEQVFKKRKINPMIAAATLTHYVDEIKKTFDFDIQSVEIQDLEEKEECND